MTTYHPDNQIHQLKEFKRKLESKQMSVLVGAGFSKNTHSIFPLWGDLLYDMVIFLQGINFEEEYEAIPKRKRIRKEDFINEKVSKYINDIGYVDIVSDYLKRKGMHEAIAAYIEEKTPKRVDENGKEYLINNLKGKKNKVQFKDIMLDVHRQLIDLPWNNIYTTNYDEMLELAVGVDIETTLKDIQISVKETIKRLHEEIKRDLKSCKEHQDELQKIENETETFPLKNEDHSAIEYPKSYHDIKGKIRNIEYALSSKKIQIKQNEKELLDVQKELDKCLQVVIHSSKLGVKRNKNIVKLHGTIRKKGDDYGFDNDRRSHYIISKEDYESYPSKHEAFTQLMRISLLQESYCLLGFSGDDPNFLEWVKWVRDVLEKQNSEDQNYKIYLIGFGGKNWTQERTLFYENHRIFPINIEDKSIIKFLETESESKFSSAKNPDENRKRLLSLLFNYLKKHDFDSPKIFLERHQSRKYQLAWDSVRLLDFQNIELEDLSKNYDMISSLKDSSWLKPYNWTYSKNKKDVIQYFPAFYNSLKAYNENEKIIDLILIALKDIAIPYNRLWENTEIANFKSLLKGPQKSCFDLLTIRTAVLEQDDEVFSDLSNRYNDSSDEMIYEKILHYAFSLEFKSLKTALNSWRPLLPQFILKKAGFLSLFDKEDLNKYLLATKESFENGKTEFLLYYYEYCNYLAGRQNNKAVQSNNESINIIQSKGYKGISKFFNSIWNEIDSKKEKIERYGSNRFTISHTWNLSNNFSKRGSSIQYLQVLLELGLPLRSVFTNLQDENRWYQVVNSIKNSYPYPGLFYSLHYENEKILRRIAQDYCYDSNLRKFVLDALPIMLDAYLNKATPNKIKRSILYFSSEFFVAADTTLWQDHFSKIWQKKDFKEQAFDSRRNEEYTILTKALPFVSDINLARSIVSECLNRADKDNAIEFLYYLTSNKNFTNIEKFQTISIATKINKIIAEVDKRDSNWFILGNLHDKLSKGQNDAIKHQLINFDYKKIKNERVWRIVYYYLKDFSLDLKPLKKHLIVNDRIFRSGLDKESKRLTGGIHHIDLTFTYDHKNFWNKSQAIKIYDKLVAEFNKIEKWRNKRDESRFTSILQDMLLFLTVENHRLKDIGRYTDIRNKIQTAYNEDRGFDKIIDALHSNDQNQILWALSDLSLIINKKLTDENEDVQLILSILLNTVISKNICGLEAILNYISSWLNDEDNKLLFDQHKTLITLLLNTYANSLPDQIDIPYVLKKLISISEGYVKSFGENPETDKWQRIKKEQQFYNY